MEPVARRLLGEPNAALSTAKILRWGTHGSMAVDVEKGVFFNNEVKAGGGTLALIEHLELVEHEGAWVWLDANFPEPKANGHDADAARIAKTYDYDDADKTLLFQVCRKIPKAFLQRRPDGHGGWSWSTKGVKQVPYRLPELLADIAAGRTIWVVEGEKDVDRLRAGGLAATTNAGGAGKWKAALNAYFKGADVVVVADNDPQAKGPDGEPLWHEDGRPRLPGQDHAAAVAAGLRPVAKRVRLLDLGKVWPDCPPKGDASNFFDAGKSIADLEALAGGLSDDSTVVAPVAAPSKAVASKLSDSGLAQAFAQQDDDARYDHAWRTWDGTRWKEDGEIRVLAGLRGWLDRSVIPAVRSRKDQLILGNNSKLRGIERELRLVHHIDSSIWDAQPWLLNTPTGTWELRGRPQLRDHRRDDLLTKITAYPAGGECVRWREFMEFVTNGDGDFATYLQRLCGYALTGLRTAQMFAFLYGSGGNGKGVLLQTITAVLGDYAAWTMSDVWLESRFPRHSEEMMVLRGARLVVASEFPENGEWNTARLKQISGGDKIRAAYKHQNSVEFQTSALLILAGNDKPALKSVDPGIVRRLHLIPFENQIDDEHRIDGLAEELAETEGGGILAWMIEGCRLWQQLGLAAPGAVTTATGEYLEDENLFAQWIEDRIDRGPGMMTEVSRLYGDWKAYALGAGVSFGSSKAFSQQFAKAGFRRYRTGGKRYFDGVRLIPAESDDRRAPF